ncbi:MAG TPA: IS3 family transposase [Chitinophagales bacterium]|nr:IS3 family transposase [Chitinophagales bacterium]
MSWFRENKSKISYSLNKLYKAICISKQAVHKYAREQNTYNCKLSELVKLAEDIREAHPGCGVEKLYETLKPDFIGRDKFIDIFMSLGFRIKRNKNYMRTTYSISNQYPNLIKGLLVNHPSHIWQTDITYIRVGERFYYAVFIIDVYTKKIVGYQVSDNMRASANIEALRKALKNHSAPLIHHSDRGGQYLCKNYLQLLEDNECQISMALSAQDNAYAERINRTIKEEYLHYWKPKTFDELKNQLKKAVSNYNRRRIHNHLNKMIPSEFEKAWDQKLLEKIPEIIIYDNEAIPLV